MPRTIHSTPARAILLALIAVPLISLPVTAADVRVVDCLAGPFLQLDPAIEAAEPGDTVLVEPCDTPYLPFSIDGKTDLHIVGNGGPIVIPAGLPDRDFLPPAKIADDPDVVGFACLGISNSEQITISNLTFDQCDFHAINVVTSEDVKILANRFEESFETVRDSTASGIQVTGNLFVGGAFAVFVDGNDALISQNVILDNQGSGISLLSPSATGNQVLGNVIVRSRSESIFSATDGARIERNLCLGTENGTSNIVLSNLTNNTLVVGNVLDAGISDSGADNVLVGNQLGVQ